MLKRRVWKPIALTVFVITLLAAALLFYSILKANVLITEYLLLAAAVMLLLLYVAGVLMFYGMRRKRSVVRRVRRIIGIILCVLITTASVYGSLLFLRLDKVKQDVSAKPDGKVKAIVGIYVKNDDTAQSISDMAGNRYAVLSELGDEKLHSNFAVGNINERLGVQVETVSYPGIGNAAEALRSGEVQALAVNEQYLTLLDNIDGFQSFSKEIKMIEEIVVPSSATLENTPIIIIDSEQLVEPTPEPTPAPTPEPTPEPPTYGEDTTLTFFLSGVDKWSAGVSNTHSDVNILMMINTKTRQVLLINTPRDYFITNPRLNSEDKLTYCGLTGADNSIAALENYYGITIDNYVKVNFPGFMTFINEIGGITLDNPVAFHTAMADKSYDFPVGEIQLDGQAALAYARERHAFGDGDLGRGRNHLRVLTAIINRLRSGGATLMMKYPAILESMGSCFETGLSSDQISDLIKIATRYLSDWDIKSYGVFGVSGKRVCASSGVEEYIIWPRDSSVNYAIRLMNMIENDEIITDDVLAEAPPPY